MTRLSPTLAAVTAILLAAPAAGAADRRVQQALAQERMYQQATVASTPRETAPADDDGVPLTLIAGAATAALALVGAGAAVVSRRDPLSPGVR
jgi:hypothetical protein